LTVAAEDIKGSKLFRIVLGGKLPRDHAVGQVRGDSLDTSLCRIAETTAARVYNFDLTAHRQFDAGFPYQSCKKCRD
jgi:hypothetical protein